VGPSNRASGLGQGLLHHGTGGPNGLLLMQVGLWVLALHSWRAQICSRSCYVSFVFLVLIRALISCPEVLLNHLVQIMQQKWG